LEAQGPEGGDRKESLADDETSLKLAVFRGMGLEAVKEGQEGREDARGEYRKIVIRDSRRGDVNIVNFEQGKLSRHFYAAHFWSVC
jgi:kinetochore protein Spc24